MMPARNSSLCETTSASAGSSRSVGMKYCDQRIEEAFSLSGAIRATRGFVVRRLDAAFVWSYAFRAASFVCQIFLGERRAPNKNLKRRQACALQILRLCLVAFGDVTSALNHKLVSLKK